MKPRRFTITALTEGEILAQLLLRAVAVRIYRGLLEKRGFVLRRADERDGQRDA